MCGSQDASKSSVGGVLKRLGGVFERPERFLARLGSALGRLEMSWGILERSGKGLRDIFVSFCPRWLVRLFTVAWCFFSSLLLFWIATRLPLLSFDALKGFEVASGEIRRVNAYNM